MADSLEWELYCTGSCKALDSTDTCKEQYYKTNLPQCCWKQLHYHHDASRIVNCQQEPTKEGERRYNCA